MAAQSTSGLPMEIKFPRSLTSLRRRRRVQNPITANVLAVVATIAGSPTTAAGSPLAAPPCFLCPFVRADDFSYVSHAPRVSPENRRGSSMSKRTTGVVHHVPDKYEQGDDGRWRRADSYSLYGSTVCTACTSSGAVNLPTHDIDAEVIHNLPNGWQPLTNKRTVSQNSLILSLSLILALCICGLILTCVLRRKWRLPRRGLDLEMRILRRSSSKGQDGGGKEAHLKQKLWVRATAKWKASARARLRRRRREQTKVAQGSSVSLPETQDPSTSNPPSLSPPSHSALNSHTPSTPNDTDPPPQPIPIVCNLPPAYNTHSPRFGPSRFDSQHKAGPSISPRSSLDDLNSHDEEIPYVSLAGHVATDDKATLERMTNCTSAPPPPSLGDESAIASASVPVWRDEELQDFDDVSLHSPSTLPPSSHSEGVTSFFPPPPTKVELPASDYYGFHEDLDVFIGDGPSAPPFEATPSAPSFEEEPPNIEGPSAPPFEAAPSAPSFEELPNIEEGFPSAPAFEDVFVEPCACPIEGELEDEGTASNLSSKNGDVIGSLNHHCDQERESTESQEISPQAGLTHRSSTQVLQPPDYQP